MDTWRLDLSDPNPQWMDISGPMHIQPMSRCFRKGKKFLLFPFFFFLSPFFSRLLLPCNVFLAMKISNNSDKFNTHTHRHTHHHHHHRSHHTFTLVPALHKVVLYAGFNGHGQPLKDAWVLDVTANAKDQRPWQQVGWGNFFA